jgi:hypothetical protein
MTVAAASRVSLAGNGATTIFTAAFRANSAAEVGVVTINDTTKVATTPILNTNYTVALSTAGLPTVTFTVAPAAGVSVILYPKNAVKQETELDAASPLYGSSIEAAIDKMAAQLQALEDVVNQALRFAQADAAPAVIADGSIRDNTFVTFNATGVLVLRPLADVGL